ncbi:MAG: type II secretion system GspH family protein [Sulfurospirillum cavolei]|nr:type II secretion system GspH family protein [Sulfurospirillum cavolei]
MKKHSAFTLIELVMVIVVFGIVAGIGAEILVKVYENYLRTRAINRLQSQTEITLEQIAKRLQYRIKDSVRASNDNGANWVALPNATVGYTVIEWIGISNESFLGEHNGASVVPGWSGFLDMEDTANTNLAARTLSTPGSTLSYARDIILALTDGNVDMNIEGGKLPALIFKGSKPLYNVNLYYNQGVNNYTTRVSRSTESAFHIPANDNIIDFDNDGFGDLFEQYYLAHTAYTLVLSANAANDGFDLNLFYNYQPWEGETYAANGTQELLAEDVSTFRIRQEGDVIRIKLCIHDNNQNSNFDFSACKEKVIY